MSIDLIETGIDMSWLGIALTFTPAIISLLIGSSTLLRVFLAWPLLLRALFLVGWLEDVTRRAIKIPADVSSAGLDNYHVIAVSAQDARNTVFLFLPALQLTVLSLAIVACGQPKFLGKLIHRRWGKYFSPRQQPADREPATD